MWILPLFILVNSEEKALHTYSAGPHVDSVGHRLHFINPVRVVQAASVPLCLAVFVGETLYRLYVGESLCGHLVGFSKWVLESSRNTLKHRADSKMTDSVNTVVDAQEARKTSAFNI